jgi:hypothetical protein
LLYIVRKNFSKNVQSFQLRYFAFHKINRRPKIII